jgi:hypothetical protein
MCLKLFYADLQCYYLVGCFSDVGYNNNLLKVDCKQSL